MRIGILGSGLMGGKLGTIFARAGHEVVFSYARSGDKLETLAAAAGHGASAGTPAETSMPVNVWLGIFTPKSAAVAAASLFESTPTRAA